MLNFQKLIDAMCLLSTQQADLDEREAFVFALLSGVCILTPKRLGEVVEVFAEKYGTGQSPVLALEYVLRNVVMKLAGLR